MADDVDGEPNSRWMTYKELAAARGISPRSAVRLAQRHKWRRQTGNDGIARVLVPASDAAPTERAARDDGGDAARDTARVITALEEALFTLKEQLGRERGRAGAAEARVVGLEAALAHARTPWTARLVRRLRPGTR